MGVPEVILEIVVDLGGDLSVSTRVNQPGDLRRDFGEIRLKDSFHVPGALVSVWFDPYAG